MYEISFALPFQSFPVFCDCTVNSIDPHKFPWAYLCAYSFSDSRCLHCSSKQSAKRSSRWSAKTISSSDSAKLHLYRVQSSPVFPAKYTNELQMFSAKLSVCIAGANLDRHVRTIHRREKPFCCTYCQKQYTTKHSLILHTQNVHPAGEGTSSSSNSARLVWQESHSPPDSEQKTMVIFFK